MMQDTFQSSPWDQCETRLQLKLWLCLAFTSVLSYYPSLLQVSGYISEEKVKEQFCSHKYIVYKIGWTHEL